MRNDERNDELRTRRGIVPLRELDDFEVAEGDPDVRGWDVRASDGSRLGEVQELLVDADARKVRYLDVELDDAIAGAGDRHVLLPIGTAQLDRNDRNVRIGYGVAETNALPRYSRERFDREYETELRSRFDRDYRASERRDDRDFYSHTLYDDSSLGWRM